MEFSLLTGVDLFHMWCFFHTWCFCEKQCWSFIDVLYIHTLCLTSTFTNVKLRGSSGDRDRSGVDKFFEVRGPFCRPNNTSKQQRMTHAKNEQRNAHKTLLSVQLKTVLSVQLKTVQSSVKSQKTIFQNANRNSL